MEKIENGNIIVQDELHVSEVEILKYQMLQERMAKIVALKNNIEIQFAQLGTDYQTENAKLDAHKVELVKKYSLGEKDTFSFLDGKITRFVAPIA